MTIHVFATILALYPFTRTEDIAEEFGMSAMKVRRMAKICRVKKSKEFRREICRQNGSYTHLRRNNRKGGCNQVKN